MAIYTGSDDLLTEAPTTRRSSLSFSFFYRGQSLSFASVADVRESRMHALVAVVTVGWPLRKIFVPKKEM